jgi:hypothetical protein
MLSQRSGWESCARCGSSITATPQGLLRIMRVFRLREVGFTIFVLKNDYDECRNKCEQGRSSGLGLPDMPRLFRDVALSRLQRAYRVSVRANLGNASEQLRHINEHCSLHPEAIDYSALAADLRNAIDAMLHDLRKREFLEVIPTLEAFVNSDSLFGAAVSANFPSAAADIKEAGNCLAADCPTAAVFHLMRVAEYGLRALAYDRRIKLDKNKPIDLATWEDLLKKLEIAEDAIKNFPKTAAREAQFDFFHGANMEVKRFKNKFRNRIMHTRNSYDVNEAISAFNHVKAFMEILSSKISERTRSPLIWKGARWIR